MPRLGDRRVLEQVHQRRELRLADRGEVLGWRSVGQLPVRKPVPERQVPGASLADCQRQPHQVRAQRIEIRRFGVEGHDRYGTRSVENPGEICDVGDELVRGVGAGGCRGRLTHLGPLQPLQQRVELQLGVELAQHVDVPLGAPELVQVQLNGHVAHDGHEVAAQPRIVRVADERLARPLPLHVFRVRQDRVQVAELLDELARGLVTHPPHAGDIVRCVPHERQIVDDPLGRHAEPLVRVLLRDPLLLDRRGAPPARVQQSDVGTDELIEVLVARHDRHREAGVGCACGEGPDHVVGLVPLDLDERHGHGFQQLLDALHRAVEIVL